MPFAKIVVFQLPSRALLGETVRVAATIRNESNEPGYITNWGNYVFNSVVIPISLIDSLGNEETVWLAPYEERVFTTSIIMPDGPIPVTVYVGHLDAAGLQIRDDYISGLVDISLIGPPPPVSGSDEFSNLQGVYR